MGSFRRFLDGVRKNSVEGDPDVFGVKDRYVKLEEIQDNNGVFGVVIDVTENVRKRREIEAERDMDPLTGLYNRRGMEQKLSTLFENPKELGSSAIVMIDADDLKVINDTYGHDMGDVYLRSIAESITDAGTKDSVAARMGGDEFVLFLYHYDDEAGLEAAIKGLADIRDQKTVALKNDIIVKIKFSLGCGLIKGEGGYQDALREADERMYEDKRKRKNR